MFLPYYFSIRYLPEVDVKTSIGLLAAGVLTAAVLLLLVTALIVMPALLWWLWVLQHEPLRKYWKLPPQKATSESTAFVAIPPLSPLWWFLGPPALVTALWIVLDEFSRGSRWAISAFAVSLMVMPLILIVFAGFLYVRLRRPINRDSSKHSAADGSSKTSLWLWIKRLWPYIEVSLSRNPLTFRIILKWCTERSRSMSARSPKGLSPFWSATVYGSSMVLITLVFGLAASAVRWIVARDNDSAWVAPLLAVVLALLLNAFAYLFSIQSSGTRRAAAVAFFILVILVPLGGGGWVSRRVVQLYGLGDIPQATLILSSAGCPILEAIKDTGASFQLDSIPSFPGTGSTAVGGVGCRANNLRILSRVGNVYYLEAYRPRSDTTRAELALDSIRFSVPSATVLSWWRALPSAVHPELRE